MNKGLRSPLWRLQICLAMLFFFCSCGVVIRSGSPSEESEERPESIDRVGRLGIPPGHLPPPGSCRIWVPGRPPGHQSPPGNCAELERLVPQGAWLVHRDVDNPDHIEVREFDEQRPSVVVVIRYFEAATGRFLSESRP